MHGTSSSPAQVFGRAGDVNVKAPSARYNTKRYEAADKRGEKVFRGGAAVELPSEREYALIGSWFRGLAYRTCHGIPPLTEHENDLLAELAHDHLWVGDVNGRYYTGHKLSDALQTRGTDFIADSTSGGTSLVPYFFDQDLVTFPLLSGELFPRVDVRELSTSNQVRTQSLANLTANWSGAPTEGSGAAVPLQTTDGLIESLTSNACDVSLAIAIGRDLLMDTPLALGQEITVRMGARLAAELDKVIAVGDGVTQPKGLSLATGTNAVSAKNGSAGPFEVADVEDMIASLPKQYRLKNDPSVCWVMNDATWFRLRGIPVSATDQRRIFGYNYEQYQFVGRPVAISNDLPQIDMFFGKLSLYRMWRRLGLKIETSVEGKALRLQHEMLITARGRYAGQFVNGAGLSSMTNAPLHS
ncbi:MAG TPA: phage major capsid protein [Pirellulales bacterium]|nr:phage major capsid protein [Pirellulales bacterium]